MCIFIKLINNPLFKFSHLQRFGNTSCLQVHIYINYTSNNISTIKSTRTYIYLTVITRPSGRTCTVVVIRPVCTRSVVEARCTQAFVDVDIASDPGPPTGTRATITVDEVETTREGAMTRAAGALVYIRLAVDTCKNM